VLVGCGAVDGPSVTSAATSCSTSAATLEGDLGGDLGSTYATSGSGGTPVRPTRSGSAPHAATTVRVLVRNRIDDRVDARLGGQHVGLQRGDTVLCRLRSLHVVRKLGPQPGDLGGACLAVVRTGRR
jgi:hypothetical protein